MGTERKIAYFSMEIGVAEAMPTYSGGLGVLAGDTILAAADVKVPMVAVSLLHRKGYFFQKISEDGTQIEQPVDWSVGDFMKEMPPRVTVTIENRTIQVRCWKYEVQGISGFMVPVYFLDTDLVENDPQDRELTHYLYGKDKKYRLCQEILLGVSGVRMLRALGYDQIERFHMNEGHASLLTLELLEEQKRSRNGQAVNGEDVSAVRRQCVFTTHTPVAAGHDQFPMDLVRQVLGPHEAFSLDNVFCCGDTLNMTYLALNLSHFVNGVAKKHGEVSRSMFGGYSIDAITNGVHATRWASRPFQSLFDKYISGWREDNFSLRYALNIPLDEVWQAHLQNKRWLMQFVNRETNCGMDAEDLTIGFARRATSYKRADLVFSDIERLRSLARSAGKIQILFAGKAHPSDVEGKELIRRIFDARNRLFPDIRIAYLSNYDMALGRLMTSGVDIWLNTPQPPMEASGTSGMKAALNGVPSLSILDGWWIEGCIEGITGWAIGENHRQAETEGDRTKDAQLLYEKLEKVINVYYRTPMQFQKVMRNSIALNGSFFNTQRMMQQYVLKAYFE
ncbi:MAG TPA: alpha-glucan family phosphorylase [Anaerohalosphaeraceae bacterium]|jgi:starch phosphorylase|nr:alpha-glucan family phosphorylase [Anaerohalosphaeraceae bacterium]